jgi:hypothetical protein
MSRLNQTTQTMKKLIILTMYGCLVAAIAAKSIVFLCFGLVFFFMADSWNKPVL